MFLRFLFILAFPIWGIYSFNTRRTDVSECFGNRCPTGTLSCRRYTTVANNKKFLDITIDCLGKDRDKLKSFNYQSSNPYDPQLHFESYSYSAVYEFERPLIIGKQPNVSNSSAGFYNYIQN